MDATNWHLVFSALITVTLAATAMVYRDIRERLLRVERKSTASLMAILVVLGKVGEVPPELLKTIHEALSGT